VPFSVVRVLLNRSWKFVRWKYMSRFLRSLRNWMASLGLLFLLTAVINNEESSEEYF
jgi:hypothetical protein